MTEGRTEADRSRTVKIVEKRDEKVREKVRIRHLLSMPNNIINHWYWYPG